MTSTKRKGSFLGWTRFSAASFASLANSLSSSSNAQTPSLPSGPPPKLHVSASVSTMMNQKKNSSPVSQRRSQSKTSSNSSRRHSDNELDRHFNSTVPLAKQFADRRWSDVVQSGWLMKRGEHIRNWRPRFFVLFSDGALLGYRDKVESFANPLNVFTVKDVQLMKVDRPKPFTFLVRGLQMSTVIERMFHTENEETREAWISAMRRVSEGLKHEPMDSDSMSVSQLPMDIGEMDSGDEDRISRTTVADAGVQQEMQFQATEQANDLNSTQMMIDGNMLPQSLFPHSEPSTSKTRSASGDVVAQPAKSVITLEDFEFLRLLGRGTFGKVLLVKEKRTNCLYAIKLLKKEVLINKDEVQHTYTENRIYTFQTVDRLCFVIEYASAGDIYFHLNNEVRRHNRSFSEERTRLYGAEICLAIGYLHDNAIIYRDLKLENILLDKEGHIKIADFGLCKEDVTYNDRCVTFCGTPEYLAPEVIEDSEYSNSVDWWSYGIVLYEMLSGRLPFFSRDTTKLFEMILTGNARYPSRTTAEARSLLSALLVKDPTRRLGGSVRDSAEIKEHPFFRCLDWDKVYRKEYEPQFKPSLQSEDDTHYFDQEFTHEPVQLTPPSSRKAQTDGIDEVNSKFTHFQFHDTYNHTRSSTEPHGHFSGADRMSVDIPEEIKEEDEDSGLQMSTSK
ncbi:AGC/AKT protein kinase [Aphelenchoides besseyi]|nr:AGC/AKT protein kinase [Aphelenchoides besseyi]KAI6199850.1 AGC/AKT protein kinase [Aphelenchoides besseyi]